MKHIKICQTRFTCRNCGKPITQGDFLFTHYTHPDNFSEIHKSPCPEYRLHVDCVKNIDLCCIDAAKEISVFLINRDMDIEKNKFDEECETMVSKIVNDSFERHPDDRQTVQTCQELISLSLYKITNQLDEISDILENSLRYITSNNGDKK